MFGGWLILVDTLWGSIAAVDVDWSRPIEFALGVSLLIGLPMFVLDFRAKRRIDLYLPSLFLFRAIAKTYIAAGDYSMDIGAVSLFLLGASVLLQLSKLKKRASVATWAGQLSYHHAMTHGCQKRRASEQ